MKRWQIFDKENIADIKLAVFGRTKKELLQNLIQAFTETVSAIKKVNKKEVIKDLKVKGENFSEVVFNFIEKLIFLKDAKFFLAKDGIFKFKNSELTFSLLGQTITKDLPIKTDIKALAKHKFQVKKEKNYYKVSLVFDI
jgi:SHS2 domain-containing protein